ncbi:MAG: hypothetical protein KJN66_06530 [Bacteroidia bacterium]|nr:hypothetical protein [Bacteroidia bacterium]
MAPVKYEENIKDKLEKRTIEPSENAWNKLSQKLDAQDESSNKSIVWWLGIAASLIGVFLISGLVFNNSNKDAVLPAVVATPFKDTPKIQEVIPEPDAVTENEIKPSKEIVISSKISNQNFIKQNTLEKTINNKNSKRENELVAQKSIEQESDKSIDGIHSKSTIEKSISNEIIAQVQDLEIENDQVSDKEVESLLHSAQSNIDKSHIFSKKSGLTVDANSLLLDIETDLDQTFRNKMFNTLIAGYNTVRVAMTERNY